MKKQISRATPTPTSLLANCLKYKIISFNYAGGTRPGSVRTIRAEEVKQNGDDVIIAGYDLDFNGNLNRGYRQYLGSKIQGEIKIL